MAILLEAGVYAAPGTRMKAFLAAKPSLFSPRPASSAANCEINSLADFQSSYSDLATLLGRPGKASPPSELEFLQRIANQHPAYAGRIGISDCLFLTAFISILAPPRVVEIGTLGGFSAAIIAAALRHHYGEGGAGHVDTIDVSTKCLIDETRPTGFEIVESFAALASMIRVHVPHDSNFVMELAEYNELEVVFIDADHRHPMVLFDLLRLAPYIRGGGWIVLHDIRLGTVGRAASEAGHPYRWGTAYGAEWLFDYWPFRKISGGNIGAIQLPNEKSELVPLALRLMSLPFEIEEKHVRKAQRGLYQTFKKLVETR